MKTLRYNYVYFNTSYLKYGKTDPNEYNTICLKDAYDLPGVKVISTPLDHFPYIIRLMYGLHHLKRSNKFFPLPFKKLWYPFIFKNDFDDSKPICFVVSTNTLPLDYLYYLKNKYPTCRIVKIHRDLQKIAFELNPDYTESNIKSVFDFRMSIDQEESEKYGMVFFHEIESKINIAESKKYPLCDVFFAGKAKDRIPKLIEAYDIFSAAGLKCYFYITNAEPNQMQLRDGVVYSNKLMSYIDMLGCSMNSKCLLDINQEGALGFTSRFLEAVIYNKLLVTDNPSVLNSKYYNSDYIQYVDNVADIDPDFVKNIKRIDFKYEGDFSPVHLIEQIDSELVKRFGAPHNC